ncbi:MAG: phosphoribosylformylglycinamidine cyclo-ligase [candidate division Zixibacteria bacterium]|nr:phosphoribosylformylglycinamidine cyclo-ligase [candidate division Zixibacteria bacterium]MDH3935955.1 phosphoribosylformylglycinamidine cyclo-ligase [candidate division Zixibacteria bacterium]
MNDSSKKTKLTYADSGVDISAGDAAVQRIKKLAASTFNDQVLSDIGAFGGLFKPDMSGLAEPVFISSTDSVGTKLKLAFVTGRHDTVGEDLINHCVGDILVHGAKPLFFLDYIGIGKLDQNVVADLVEGLSRGCRNVGMALLGGETAELTDLYQPGEYDLAGFIVGMADRANVIDGSAIKEGDVCLGLPSNGLHTNGFTLARKVVFEIARLKPDDFFPQLKTTIGEALLAVHRCYAPIVHPLLPQFAVHGMAHITGGGIQGNLNRVMPDGLSAEIDKSKWPVPPIFTILKDLGNIDPDDIYRTFNMGIGYIIVVEAKDADSVCAAVEQMGEQVYRIGRVVTGSEPVVMIGD